MTGIARLMGSRVLTNDEGYAILQEKEEQREKEEKEKRKHTRGKA